MTRNNEHGIFTAMGKAADESLEIAAAIRNGSLTRHQFDDWYARRRSDGEGLVITLRERTSDVLRPVEAALARGEELLRSVAPAAPVRRHGRGRRTVRHSERSRRKAK